MPNRRRALALSALTTLLVLGGTMPSGAAQVESPYRTPHQTAPTPRSDKDVIVTPLTFDVTNPGEPGSRYSMTAYLYEPRKARNCRSSVIQALHGLTNGRWYWDLPYKQDTYSVARAMAKAGYPFLAYDRFGYGENEKGADGYTLTGPNMANVTHQITQQLRNMGFGHVGLYSHSGGNEIAEQEAATFGDADALIVSGYNHFPTPEFAQLYVGKELARTANGPVTYFFGDEATRDHFIYTDMADPAVIAAQHPLVNNTPSGETLSIGSQPSRVMVPLITAPTVLLVSGPDRIVDGRAQANAELNLWTGTSDVTNIRYPNIGHAIEMHRNAPQVHSDVVSWLQARPEAMPGC